MHAGNTPRSRGARIDRLRGEIAEFLLPQRCVVCGRFGASLHTVCVATLPAATMPRCLRCWRPSAATWCEQCAEPASAPAFDGLRAAFQFEGDARRAILEAKFRGVTAHLSPLAVAAAGSVPEEWRVDAVVPIPLARRRRRARGYNQSDLIARAVAEACGLPLRAAVLARHRETTAQASLSAERRHTNLIGAFTATDPPRRPLLVDDVTTTGATFEVAAAALRAAGAERVYALALARED